MRLFLPMSDDIEISASTLHELLTDYIQFHADQIARMMIDGLFVDAVAMNCNRDNDGADVRLSLKIPSSEECREIVDTDDIMSIRCPGI